MTDPRPETLDREARREWEALGLVSYTGGQADLGEDDVAQIRDLIKRLADELRNTQADCATAEQGALAAEQRAEEAERELREEWWRNHGHDYHALYGDDGELQCQACPADFKRQPLDELRRLVLMARAERASAALAPHKATEEDSGRD